MYAYATDTHKNKRGNTSSLTDKTPGYDCRKNLVNAHTDAETGARDRNGDDFDTHSSHPTCSSDPMSSSDTSASCDCHLNFVDAHTDARPYARNVHAPHSDCTCNNHAPLHTSSNVTPCHHSSSNDLLDKPRAVPDTSAYAIDTHSMSQLCSSDPMSSSDKIPNCDCHLNFVDAHTDARPYARNVHAPHSDCTCNNHAPLHTSSNVTPCHHSSSNDLLDKPRAVPDTSAYAIDTHSMSQLCSSDPMSSSDKIPNCGCPLNFVNAHTDAAAPLTDAAAPLPDTNAYVPDTHSSLPKNSSDPMSSSDTSPRCERRMSQWYGYHQRQRLRHRSLAKYHADQEHENYKYRWA